MTTIGKYMLSPPTLGDGQQQHLRLDSAGALVTTASTVASGATDSGNPVKVGGVYSSSPITLTNGQRGDLQVHSDGTLKALAFSINTIGADGIANTAIASMPIAGFAPSSTTRPLATVGYVFNGSTVDRLRGDTNGVAVQPGLSSTFWSYSNGASGILSNTTTAVTIKAAAGASIRNCIDSLQITTTAFGAAVPLAIRDGAGGTVLWAMNVPTSGFLQPVTVVFPVPLRSTANTLLEVVTTTANTSGTVWISVQGHTGA